MNPKAGLSQISFLLDTLRHYRLRIHNQPIEVKSYNDPGPTWTALWEALWNDETNQGKITDKQYRRYLALCYQSPETRAQLERELEQLTEHTWKKNNPPGQ